MSRQERNRSPNAETDEPRLPFDPRTLLLGLWRRRYVFAASVLFFAALGVFCGLEFGTRQYEAESVLLYRPNPDIAETETAPELSSLLEMVKIQPNLEEVRRRLALDRGLAEIARSIDVTMPESGDILLFHAVSDTPEGAAALANTMRDVFLESQIELHRKDVEAKTKEIETRLEKTTGELEKADEALGKFVKENKIVDIDREAAWYLDELKSAAALYEEALIRKKTLELQQANIGKVIDDLKKRIAKEEASTSAVEGLGHLNIRLQNLRSTLAENKEQRANNARLAELELEYKQALALKKDGLISEVEFNKTKAAYEAQKAYTVDTEETKALKREIARLNEVVLPDEGKKSTPAGALLQQMMMKEFDIQLEALAVDEKVEHLERAKEKIQKKLDELPEMQRAYVALNRELSARRAEKESLEKMLVTARNIAESNATGFTVLSNAKPPVMASNSDRRLIATAVAVMGILASLALVVLLEIADFTIKTPEELELKIGRPVLAVLPRARPGERIFPGGGGPAAEESGNAFRGEGSRFPCGDPVFIEEFRILAHTLRRRVPRKGARILVTAPTHGEGTSLAAANLAACLGREDERVLLIDAGVRRAGGTSPVEDILIFSGTAAGPLMGLGEYLSYEAASLDEILQPATLPGVECLPCRKEAVIPEMLGTQRMGELLEEASERFSVILFDAPPVVPYVDADTLARWSDAALLVVRSRHAAAATVRKAVQRLADTEIFLTGVVLNDVLPIYLRKEEGALRKCGPAAARAARGKKPGRGATTGEKGSGGETATTGAGGEPAGEAAKPAAGSRSS